MSQQQGNKKKASLGSQLFKYFNTGISYFLSGACVCSGPVMAALSKRHNDANVIACGCVRGPVRTAWRHKRWDSPFRLWLCESHGLACPFCALAQKGASDYVDFFGLSRAVQKQR